MSNDASEDYTRARALANKLKMEFKYDVGQWFFQGQAAEDLCDTEMDDERRTEEEWRTMAIDGDLEQYVWTDDKALKSSATSLLEFTSADDREVLMLEYDE